MITPDTKDWTWVLLRACPDCGFDAAAVPGTSVPAPLRANAVDWEQLLAAGQIRAGRPDHSTWSSLEYACHVRDVFRRFDNRVALMLTEDDPLFENWDQDASAVSGRYEGQIPAAVVGQLVVAAGALSERLASVKTEEWQRSGRRTDGAVFTVDTIARYMIHDPIHHLWDVGAGRT